MKIPRIILVSLWALIAFSFICVGILLFRAQIVNAPSGDGVSQGDTQGEGTDSASSGEDAENTDLRKAGDQVALALKNEDGTLLSSFVHPTLGVSFSNYFTATLGTDQHFTAAQVSGAFLDATVYDWGTLPASGLPIQKTFKDFISGNIYDEDFASAPAVSLDAVKLGAVAATSNLQSTYPNAMFVTYAFSGFDPEAEGMDWQALYLGFEKQGDAWYLVNVARGYWTP